LSCAPTDAVFNGYNIVSAADIQEAAHKTAVGAICPIHRTFIVEPEEPERRKENARKPV
jgi:hypothetical protein